MAELRDNALLIRSIPYSDSSFIAHCFTQHHGRISLMARGARRAKSPFRAGLMPLHQLQIRWKEPRTGSMGTLLEVQRGKALLPESYMLSGQDLLAKASFLFPDGNEHGFTELYHALSILKQRREDTGTLAASWVMLEHAGLVGDLNRCWRCNESIDLSNKMVWYQAGLLCLSCSHRRGTTLSSGFRKSIHGQLHTSNIMLGSEYIKTWNNMITDVHNAFKAKIN